MKITLICLLLSGLAGSAFAQQNQISKENKTIAITTSDDASALADVAVVSVGFTLYGRDQDATYVEATRKSNSIISALLAAGISKEAIASNSQRLSHIDPDGDSNKVRYGQGLRFEFAQSWRVTVPASEAAETLHLAIVNGASDSGGIDWQLAHEDALQGEAASKALRHARDIATQMALGLGTKLGALVYASNQAPPRGIYGLFGGGGQLNTESDSLSAVVKI